MTQFPEHEAYSARIEERIRQARWNPKSAVLPSAQVRDLTVIDLSDTLYLVVAVDSDGGIGPKDLDVVKTGGRELGRFGTRVPMMEILASGAVPIAAFDPLTVEMKPLGCEIIRGIREELASIGLPEHFPLSGSTEDNVPTRQTGMGMVIIGLVAKQDFRPGRSRAGDEVICIGVPKSGPADVVHIDDPEIADAATMQAVGQLDGVHDVLPVGSRGILYEVNELARTAGLRFLPGMLSTLNLQKSAGPSTCFIVSGNAGLGRELITTVRKPLQLLGTLI